MRTIPIDYVAVHNLARRRFHLLRGARSKATLKLFPGVAESGMTFNYVASTSKLIARSIIRGASPIFLALPAGFVKRRLNIAVK